MFTYILLSAGVGSVPAQDWEIWPVDVRDKRSIMLSPVEGWPDAPRDLTTQTMTHMLTDQDTEPPLLEGNKTVIAREGAVPASDKLVLNCTQYLLRRWTQTTP